MRQQKVSNELGKDSAKRAMPNGENMFLDELTRLSDAATQGEWMVDPDDRPGMSWNNHIVQRGTSNTICFMAHDPQDNSAQEAAAELMVILANRRREIMELVKAAKEVVKWSDRDTEIADLEQALNALDKEG